MAPAQTSVSLLARAILRPASIASSVGRRPTAPDTAVTTHSPRASGGYTQSLFARRADGHALARERFAQLAVRPGSEAETYSGAKSSTCFKSSPTFLFAAMAGTRMPSRLHTAALWRAYAPGEPRITLELTIIRLFQASTAVSIR